ncbi:MAG TPA: LamG domain-containing protein [Lacipirellulaceae bacterium]|nr:LamG domain-containing protein [Lacipirellulaceae bacterium]
MSIRQPKSRYAQVLFTAAGIAAILFTAGKAASVSAQPVPIAHWSFDTATITTDASGIATAEDIVATHDAVRTNATTGPRPINSVPGQFGQAAQFTNILNEDAMGASRLQIPNLMEIMGESAEDFSVGVWVNIPTGVVGQDNTILSDWVSTHSYWFQIDAVDSNLAARPRGQIRNLTGGDIIAATINAQEAGQANMADSAWHHYAWTWDKSEGVMTWFIDGVQRATRTTGQAAEGRHLRVSSNPNAHIGWKQDSNDHFSGTMDELWVFEDLLTPEQVETLMLQNGFGPPPMPGDVDLDGDVDIDDFAPIRDNFRKSVATRQQGDLVRNSVVDFDDFHEWKTAFLAGGGSLAGVDLSLAGNVPEPATVMLVLLAAGPLLRRPQRM